MSMVRPQRPSTQQPLQLRLLLLPLLLLLPWRDKCDGGGGRCRGGGGCSGRAWMGISAEAPPVQLAAAQLLGRVRQMESEEARLLHSPQQRKQQRQQQQQQQEQQQKRAVDKEEEEEEGTQLRKPEDSGRGEAGGHDEDACAEVRRVVERQSQQVAELQRLLTKSQETVGTLEKRIKALQQQQLGLPVQEAKADDKEGGSGKSSNISSSSSRSSSSSSSSRNRDGRQRWQQHTFREFNASGFIQFSAYRISRSRVAIVGLALDVERTRTPQACEWHISDSSSSSSTGGVRTGSVVIQGQLEWVPCMDHHNRPYGAMIMTCTLADNMTRTGGHVQTLLSGQLVELYEEQPSTLPLAVDEAPFKYELAYCGVPMFGDFNPKTVADWLEYHRVYVDADHFVLYDAGAVDANMTAALAPFARAGLVTVVPFADVMRWDTWYQGIALALNDCPYALRNEAKWVFTQDLDEYFELRPPQPLKQLLNSDKYADAAWLSHGTIWFMIRWCTAEEKASLDDPREFVISASRNRLPGYRCKKEGVDRRFCDSFFGYRKTILNPRKVTVSFNHKIDKYEGRVVHLNADEVRHAHFRGITWREPELCLHPPPTDGQVEPYLGILHIVHAVVACRGHSTPQACTLSKLLTQE